MDAAQALVRALRGSTEYQEYKEAQAFAMESERTQALYGEYKRLQIQAQANAVAQRPDADLLARLQQIGEMLHYDEEAAAFLSAEYKLNEMLGTLYKMLAKAVDADLSALEG